MTEPQTQTPHRKIDWIKSAGNLALGVWGVVTFIALLAGIAWVAAATTGPNPKAVAVFAVLSATCVNWALFAVIERHTRN
ncbi:MAG TPA: hypothetical protein PKJ98_04595 [Verrucomicrobiota bacterium]|nr:hypothetical protein [Verrucomicrobiota bacterium]